VLEGASGVHDGDGGSDGYDPTTNAYDYFSDKDLVIFQPMLDYLHH